MSKEPAKISRTNHEELKHQLGPIYRKVGIITFTVGLVGILIGFLIDHAIDTTPVCTLTVLVISVPLALLLNMRMLRRETEKILALNENKTTQA